MAELMRVDPETTHGASRKIVREETIAAGGQRRGA
jgi:hypothetical protein